MKKIVLGLLVVLMASKLSFAALQFGVTGQIDGGVGVSLVNDSFSTSALISQIQNINGVDGEDRTSIELNAKYKVALQEKSKATFGLRYLLLEEKAFDDDDSDENTKIALTSGIEYQISSKLSLFAETDVYSIKDVDDGETETSMFNSGRVGVTFLF